MSKIISYSLIQTEDGRQFSAVLENGAVKTVSEDHPNFDKLISVLTSQPENWEVTVAELMDLVGTLKRRFRELTPRVTTDGETIFFDGDKVDSSLSTYILKLLRAETSDEGELLEDSDVTWQALVRFLELLYSNPNPNSRESLYEFLKAHGLTIRKDGHFIAYKGLLEDYNSINAGYGIVDGVEYDGHLPNKPGSVVRFPRADVDDNTEVGCSQGLHAGTLSYASDFARGRVVAVAVNPMNVVSVPEDCSFQKIRTCEYEVLLEIDVPKENRATTGEAATPFWRPTAQELYTESGHAVIAGSVIDFDYTSRVGAHSNVEGLTVDQIEYDLVHGRKANGDYRTYIISSMKNVKFYGEVEEEFVRTAAPTLNVAEGDVLSFVYVGSTGEAKQLDRVTVVKVEDGKLHGTLADGSYRTYFVDQVEELIKNSNKADAQQQSPIDSPYSVGQVLSFDYHAFGQFKRVENVKVIEVSQDFVRTMSQEGNYRSYRVEEIRNVSFVGDEAPKAEKKDSEVPAPELDAVIDGIFGAGTSESGRKLLDFFTNLIDDE